MINACGNSIPFPLKLIFKSIINEGVFPKDWKKSNVAPIHKKESNNLIKNYRPISHLPIFSKAFERPVFNALFNIFNNHFASQCTPIKNGSKLTNFSYKTEKRLTSFDIKNDGILLIIKDLNVDKGHGWDQLSIRMIEACGNSIPFQLKLILKSVINEGVFPEDWKKSKVVPIHKKESKNLIKNYRPISLLPIFSKLFERLDFSALFNFFLQNNLFALPP